MTSLDIVWDCMNVASRICKQIENSDNLVPKTQTQPIQANVLVTPLADLQELLSTVTSVRTTSVPFVTSSKKSKVTSEPSFETCIKGIKETLLELHQFLKDLEKEFSIYTWKTQKVKVYQIDFVLKQKLDQFSALFNPNDDGPASTNTMGKGTDKKLKEKQPSLTASLIQDLDGKEMWVKSFGETTLMVPWTVFLSTLEAYLGTPLKEDDEYLKLFLDFTRTDHVSSYEFSVFLKWFGPLKGCGQRILEALKGGLLCGFVPAVEANLLLEGKKEGTFLIRCSKTQPGSFAVTFVDNMGKIKHCLLYAVTPNGLTLKNPPTVYSSLKEFVDSHTNKLKHPLGNKWTLKHKLPGFAYDGKISEGPDTNSNTTTTHEGQCIVCMDAPFETVFLECGHLACCQTCSTKLKLCPICRNTIVRVVPIFRAM